MTQSSVTLGFGSVGPEFSSKSSQTIKQEDDEEPLSLRTPPPEPSANVKHWLSSSFSASGPSVAAEALRPSSPDMPVKPLEDANILTSYGPATKRLLLFDYDGTLTDIVRDPAKALLGEPVLEAINDLASRPENHVWVISGRDRDFLGGELGHIARLGLVAEHGAFMRYPETKDWLNKCENADMSWKLHVESKMMGYVKTVPGSTMDRKTAAVVWHFRNVNTSYAPANHAAELKSNLEKSICIKWPVEITYGKCIVEARLRYIHKGQIARQLAQEIKPDFVFCAGDDLTDEGIAVLLLTLNVY